MDNKAIPIITANSRPVRFVLRDETDAWSPTNDEIYNNKYDYVKLHRLTTYFDVGIAPYSMAICVDGTLVLPALPLFENREVALRLFNRTLCELLIGGLYCEAIAPEDIGFGQLYGTGYTRVMNIGDRGTLTSFFSMARAKFLPIQDAISLLHLKKIYTAGLLEHLNSGRNLFKDLGDIPREQVLYGTSFYVRKQWAESLIHIWTVTERITELAWQKQILSIKTISKHRRQFLGDQRTWTIATKLEVLHQKNLLPGPTLELLNLVRKARNNFAHAGIHPSHEIATKALTGCFELASLVCSNFKSTALFEHVVSLVIEECNPTFVPKAVTMSLSEAQIEDAHWFKLPPIPGDGEWGDLPYETFEDLRLNEMPNNEMMRAKDLPKRPHIDGP